MSKMFEENESWDDFDEPTQEELNQEADIYDDIRAIKLELAKINTPWRGPEHSDFRGTRLEVPFEMKPDFEVVYPEPHKKDWEDKAIDIRTAVVNGEDYEYLPFFIYNSWTKQWKEVNYGDYFKSHYEFIK
ncbi:hypothetical protein [Serratia ureilytica]|uniref:hypothetical protein n=1 Tax=Serratia ureilytica TaxID=300181 RepID=UPI0019D31B47|nr:hypothetical protein [Serratia ureilytica]MBN5214294.1 hypothetical protein [Serratia ureilytica]MDR2288591.1 hypothetical protein [Serratia marcescens]